MKNIEKILKNDKKIMLEDRIEDSERPRQIDSRTFLWSSLSLMHFSFIIPVHLFF